MPQPSVIDLSHYQTIPKSLHDAAASGVVGVIHKATEGLRSVDTKCKARFSLTRDAGLLFGIYHFLRPGRILQQADFFLSQKDVIDAQTLLICDFEVDGITLDEVYAFLSHVERESGQIPVLYSGSTLKQLGGAVKCPVLARYRLWLAQYGPTARLPKGYDRYWLWQYSENGTVPGVDGSVDVNHYDGTANELKQDWVIKSSAAASDSSTATDKSENSDTSTNPPVVSTPEGPPNNIKAEITPDGGVKVETNQPTGPKERIAVVKTKPKTWTQAIVAKITAAVTGNAFFQWLWAQQDRVTGLSLPDLVWVIVSLTIAIGFLLWIVYEIIATYRWNKYQENVDALLVKENSTPENLVQLIPPDELELYRARGFKIITRGEPIGDQK